MRVLSVVGARPQFVKLAPVAAALTGAGHEHVIVHTGQHYDVDLSDVFFTELKIPDPDVHLGVGTAVAGQGQGAQTGAMLAALDGVLAERRPDWVLVYGDTNSTLAGTVSAVKLHLPVAHLEAGLRSFNRRMPEEHNRVLTDHAADLLLAPTTLAVDNLAREGLAGRTVLVGDVMTDVLYTVRDAIARDGSAGPFPGLDGAGSDLPGHPDGYVVATVHRAENTDDPVRLRAVLSALAALPVPVALFAHPRLLDRAARAGLDVGAGAVRVARPLPYPAMVRAVLGSRGVVTDSGGLQKESFLLRRPCTTLRTETEWPETLAGGWNVLVPDVDNPAALCAAVLRADPTPRTDTPYGDGHAAEATVRVLAALPPGLAVR